MPELTFRIREQLIGAATDAGRTLSCVELALRISTWIERDYRDPSERAAVTLVTRDGRVAELWRALHAQLADAAKQLSDLCVDLGLLNEALDEGERRAGTMSSLPGSGRWRWPSRG